MYTAIYLIGICFTPPQDELAARLRQRDQILNNVTAEYVHELYSSPRTAPPFDMSAWRRSPDPRTFRITMSQPNVMVQALDERPDLGYAAVEYRICGDHYLAQWAHPDSAGRQVIMYNPIHAHEGVFLWSAALEVFEFRIACQPRRYENLLSLLESGRLEVLGSNEDVISCRFVDELEDGATCERFWEVDATGFARQASATIVPVDPAQLPITSDWFVLATQDYCGVTVAADIAVIVDNPNVSEAPGRTVQRIMLTSIQGADSDALVRLCDMPKFRNANVTELQPDGTRTRRIYDADGNVIQTDRFGLYANNSPVDLNSRRALAWEWITLPAAAGFMLIGFVAWAVGRTTRP